MDRSIAYRPEIDGLRALAVLPVLFFHAGFETFAGGYLGVDVFFVISGYLITSLIALEIASGRFSFLAFHERRARRILPALFVVCALSAAGGWLSLSPDQLSEFGDSLVATSLFFSNLAFYAETGYSATAAELRPLFHTWSLAIEEQFYIVFPIILVAIFMLFRSRFLPALTFLAILSLAAAEYVSRSNQELAFFALHTRGWELFAGAIIALSQSRLASLGLAVRAALAWIGLIACVGSFAVFDGHVRHPSLITLLPVAGAALVVAFSSRETLPGRLLSWPPLVGIGLISYSLYLFHQPVFAFYRILQARDVEPLEFVPLIFACLTLAYANWMLIERPFRNRRTVERYAFGAAAATFLLLPVAAGIAYSATEGFPYRLGGQAAQALQSMREGSDARPDGIRLGTCHFNSEVVAFEKFFADWDCLARENTTLLVFGDSHAADKSWALRTAGVAIANFTGGGCPLVPTPTSSPCLAIMNRVVDLARKGSVSGIVLASRWEPWQLEPAALEKFKSFWQQAKVPILIFTPMPEFPHFEEQIMRNALLGLPLDEIAYDGAKLGQAEGALMSMGRQAGFTVLNTRKLFCGNAEGPCSAFESGRPLLIDYGHLSLLGAQTIGKRAVGDPAWQQWLRTALQSLMSAPDATGALRR